MDKRFKPLPLPEQLGLRRRAIDEVLAHPEWQLAQAVRHIRTTLRLTVREMAHLAKVSTRTLQDIEAERSAGTVQTLNSVLGVLGLRLGAQRVNAARAEGTAATP